MISFKSVMRVCLFILPLAVLSLGDPESSAQTHPFERSFLVSDKPQIIISNASAFSIAPWHRSEVSLSAESPDAQVLAEEVEVHQDKDLLNLSFHTLQVDKNISLTLRVPQGSMLEIKTLGIKIHVRQPIKPVRMSISEDFVYLDVPEGTALDLEGVPRAEKCQQVKNATDFIKIGGRRSGQGPPFVKVYATDAVVLVSNKAIEYDNRPPTYAAQMIARWNGLMGSRLRKSYPQLIRPDYTDHDQVVPVSATETGEEALRLETHLINLHVSVTDRDGKAIPGLRKDDFSIYEDGVLQPIAFFSPEQSPFNLILLIDLSGSVKEKIDLIKETALHFIDITNEQDSIAVITFSADVIIVSHLTRDREELRNRINVMQTPWGGTSFYDALGYTLVEELRRAKGQRNAVIAITDGRDNAIEDSIFREQLSGILKELFTRTGSFLTFDQLLDGVIETEALVYPIYLADADQHKRQSLNPGRANQYYAKIPEIAGRQLQQLAQVSGARMYRAERIEDLKGVFDQVAAELRTIYSMAYSPSNTNFDGSFRQIRVQVNRPGVALRTRRGYYAR